ncbi:MAG: SEC-C domain-containing protein [Hydrogenophilales bacterium]|nr:SEC-C domain-containing protein [Hydrogenophilales bacterium]
MNITAKTGRNDPCPCGSGKKYKHCCLTTADTINPDELLWQRVRRAIDGLTGDLFNCADTWYGPDALYEAWDEFVLWDETPFEPESPYIGLFMPWYLFEWMPDPIETTVPEAAQDGIALGLAYLRRKGKYLDPLRARYVEQCCAAAFSFHDVAAVQPGRGFVLRDIFTGEETEVAERSGSQSAKVGDILYAKVVRTDGLAIVDGCSPIAFPPIEKAEILDLRAGMLESHPVLTPEILKDWDGELRDLYLDIADRLLNPQLPALQNTDGDALLFHKLHFEIPSPRAAFDALKHLCITMNEDELLADAVFDSAGALCKIEFPWQKAGNKRNPGWDNTVLGNIAIDGDKLTLEVNSENRAEAARALVEGLLHGQARYQTTVIESAQAMLERASQEDDSPLDQDSEDLNAHPEVQAQLQQMLRDYYREWPHQAVPALNGLSPLEAMQTQDGPEMVEALLLQIERYGQQQQQPLDPAILAELRAKLGLEQRPLI